MKAIKNDYICHGCCCVNRDAENKSFNFDWALERLELAATSTPNPMQELQNACFIESIMIRSTKMYNYNSASIDTSHLGIDLIANNMLKTYNTNSETNRKAFKAKGDGNCLFNAVSVATFGNESKSTELRFRVVLEMVANKCFYEQLPGHEKGYYDTIAGTLDDNILRAAKNYSWSSVYDIHALASILNCTITAIYPPINGLLDINVRSLNRRYLPRQQQQKQQEITIMWTSTSSPQATKELWQPNHFVPILTVDIECVEIDVFTDEEQESDEPNKYDNLKTNKINGQQLEPQSQIMSTDSECQTDSDEVSQYGALKANPNNGKYMGVPILVKKITSVSTDSKLIPKGRKQNEWFGVNVNGKKFDKVSGKVFDDCGAWTSTSYKTHCYLVTNYKSKTDFDLKYIENRDGKYSEVIKKQRVMLNPQPFEKDILKLRRVYCKLQRNGQYQKRSSFILQQPAAFKSNELNDNITVIVEYIGEPTPSECHGNAKLGGNIYMRTDPDTLKEMKHRIKSKQTNREIYSDLVLQDPNLQPRNLKQVQNLKANINLKNRPLGSHTNVDDELQNIISNFHNDRFIQKVIQRKSKKMNIHHASFYIWRNNWTI